MKNERVRRGMKIAVSLFVLSLTVPLRAQLGNEGSIEGIVTDPSGAVVVGVFLKARNTDTSATFTATSDVSGLFPSSLWAPMNWWQNIQVSRRWFRKTWWSPSAPRST